MSSRRRTATISQNRIIGLLILAHSLVILIILRLVQIQIIDRKHYIEQAKKQYFYETELKSQRGIIYDRNLNPLAVNVRTASIAVDGKKVGEKADSLATFFADWFGQEKSYFLKKIDTTKSFIWIKRFIPFDLAMKINERNLPGVRIIKEEKRYYPHGSLGANIVGFTNIDMNGLSGIEKVKDNILKGDDGLKLYQRDRRGRRILDLEHPVIKPQRGKDIVLTINSTFQWIAQEELKKAVESYEADAGVVIISKPATGELLSMAVFPDFDPNHLSSSTPKERRNRAITDLYEPGSTFKSMVMAAIIEENLAQPDDIVFCENGKYNIYGREISDVAPYGWLSVAKVIKKSSNIGMAKLVQKIDKRTLYGYLRKFGFGLETGIELPGEVSGELNHFTKWDPAKKIWMSIGYGISVTPLQMVMAYGAIANGGLLLKPQIIKGVIDKNFNKELPVKPQVIRRVISDSTARKLTNMLEQVVYNGTGAKAYIKGLRIAGKTGTAMKYDPQTGYSRDKFISSFIGFFPANSPELLIYVMLDNPKLQHLGGRTAAPTFKNILERLLRFVELEQKDEDSLKVNPDFERNLRVPSFVNRRIDFVRTVAVKNNWELIEENPGNVVVKQRFIKASRENQRDTLVVQLRNLVSPDEKYTAVPDVRGKVLRDAVSELSRHHLKVYVRGSGIVRRQIPNPGTKMRVQARCIVECEPPVQLTHLRSFD